MLDRALGPLLVAAAALLWGTDSLFRFKTVAKLDPTFIVFCEHVLGIVVLFPFVWRLQRPAFFKLGFKGWLSAAICGAGGGAIATVLFTASFRWLNPSVVILLQKLQPVFVVLLAYLFLGERPARKFYPWAAVAIAAGFVLSFPDLDVSFLRERGNLHAKGVTYSLIACATWAASTVAGRALVARTTPALATFWRYFFGTAMLVAILVAASVPVGSSAAFLVSGGNRDLLMAMLYLAFVTGLVPMVLYYGGMARTEASVVTFIELLYPVSAVIINSVFLHATLSNVQLGAGGALLLAVTMISIP
jgi:drug/metabolite transporter (DMT)-like permease